MKSAILAASLSLIAGVAGFGDNNYVNRVEVSSNASSSTPLPPSQDPWYSAPPGYESTAPGTILKIRVASQQAVKTQTNSASAYNILFRSTDSLYKPTWAVTTLFVPANPDPTKLLSYQIPYDSADVDASPSFTLLGQAQADIVAALGKGWFVASPDYEGPKASFTAGVNSGHATLDSIRAILAAGLGLDNNNDCNLKYALWGYSGGALASEWAAELQVQYAPELQFAGAALGGLTPNVTSVVFAVNGGIEAGLIPSGILGLMSQHPDLNQLVEDALKKSGPHNATGFNAAKNYTLLESIGAFIGQDITSYFNGGASLLSEPVAKRVTNRDGVMGYHGVPEMPIFAYKAIQDEISPVKDTDDLVARYCAVGATIRYDRNTIGSHTTESSNGDARAVNFLTSVLGGTYNATGCQIQNVTISASNSSTSTKKLRARTVILE